MFVVEAARGQKHTNSEHTRAPKCRQEAQFRAGVWEPDSPFRPQEPPPAGATGVGVCVRVLLPLSIVSSAAAIVMFLYADVP